jgi:Got1/Sft2-like family
MAMFALGIIFLFDRALIIMGNVTGLLKVQLAFIVGLVLLIGFKSTIGFFTKKGKIKGSLVFFLGFVIIVARYPMVGFIVQLWGLFLLFKSFLPFIYDSATKLPIIGRYLRNPQIKYAVDNLSRKGKGPEV